MDIHLLIEKFWNGTASDSEKQQLLRILNEQGKDIEKEMSTEFDRPLTAEPVIEKDHQANVLKSIHEKIQEPDQIPLASRRKKILSWAAVALVLIGCTVGWQLFNKKGAINPVKTVSVRKADTIFNPGENIESVTLPDQSNVLLYPGSLIAFEHGFQKRDIVLTGKASFHVMHDSSRVFTVTTGEVLTTDIGTVFEIDARSEKEVLVRLMEGKIKVGQTPGSLLGLDDQLLSPGESIRINVYSGQIHLAKPNLVQKRENNGKANRLTFNKTPLEEVFKEVGKKYQVKIKFKQDDIANLSFSGTIEAKDSLSKILDIICYMNNLKCKQQGNIYTIQK